nr:P-type conjugative transfer protein TrbG [Pseudomonas sp. PDM20]
MQKHVLAVAVAAVLAPLAAIADEAADLYLSPDNIELTPQEKASLAISQRWQQSKGYAVGPTDGGAGRVMFTFGAEQPTVVCAPLQVCDVALQAGEQVNALQLGDTIRWSVDPAITGSGEFEVQHLIIKAHDVGLETSLMVATDRRTYHFKLRSHRTDYMQSAAFNYPEEAARKWEALTKRRQEIKKKATIPESGEYLGNLSFAYDVKGDAPWKPVRVYNNGIKTIIEFPKSVSQDAAPVLMVIRKEGGWFSDDQTELVNYSFRGTRMIVDSLFSKAVLLSGVGKDQLRIAISKED